MVSKQVILESSKIQYDEVFWQQNKYLSQKREVLKQLERKWEANE